MNPFDIRAALLASLPGLVLAGDYTYRDYPATLEIVATLLAGPRTQRDTEEALLAAEAHSSRR